ncbi:hypothetical protein [Photobacterium sp. CCB-ST2H9]|uniref:DUF7661 family protein n=1 Tax=Photobacterium sp. CCB-ST2H9 TaxID=2912855 RepID=UPI003532592A
MMFIKFNVFGHLMSVQRKDGEWLLFMESETSLRARVYDVVIPSDLQESELAGYLADIYHEQASAQYPDVQKY